MKRKTALPVCYLLVLFMALLAMGCGSFEPKPIKQAEGPVCVITKIDENLFSVQALKAEYPNGYSSGFGQALDSGLNELKKEYFITGITPVTYYIGHGSATMKLYVFVTPKDISKLFSK